MCDLGLLDPACPKPTYIPNTPPIYIPDFWNSSGLWGSENIKGSNNCYSYAINRPYLPDGSPRPKGRPQPGGSTCRLDCNSLIAAAKKDGLTDTDAAGNCPAGWHKVFLVIAPGVDYHWYRQDSDGTWSHKRGNGMCTNRDAAGIWGNIITDPSTCDRDYGCDDIWKRNKDYN